MKNFTITFKCSVCGLPTENTLTLSTKFWHEETGVNRITGKHWSYGYVDIRHESCELMHGSFKAMTEEYMEKVDKDPKKAEDFVKANRKKGDFNREMTKELEKLEEKNGIIIKNNKQ